MEKDVEWKSSLFVVCVKSFIQRGLTLFCLTFIWELEL